MITRKKRVHMILLSILISLVMAAGSILFTIRPAAAEEPAHETSLLQELNEPEEADIDATGSPLEAVRSFNESLTIQATVTPLVMQQSLRGIDLVTANSRLSVLQATLDNAKAEDAGESNMEDPEEDSEPGTPAEDYSDEPSSESPYDDNSYDTDGYASYEEPSYEDTTLSDNSSSDLDPTEEPTDSGASLTAEEESTAPEPQETANSSSDGYSDLDYLAAICQIEAGYNYDGCLAVANVVLNRLHAGFASSIYGVIYAPYQFATYNMDYWLRNGTSDIARQAAADALAGSNNVGSYLYFNGQTWLDPSTLSVPYVVIGGNVFY